jgi:hypothetical protein
VRPGYWTAPTPVLVFHLSELIRTRYRLSPDAQPGDLASILERAAQQTDLLSNEIAHWEQIANARL